MIIQRRTIPSDTVEKLASRFLDTNLPPSLQQTYISSCGYGRGRFVVIKTGTGGWFRNPEEVATFKSDINGNLVVNLEDASYYSTFSDLLNRLEKECGINVKLIYWESEKDKKK